MKSLRLAGDALIVEFLSHEAALRTGSVVELLVQDALAASHNRGNQSLTGNVQSGTAHVNNRVNRQEQTHAVQGQTQSGKGQGQHHDSAGRTSGCCRTEHGHHHNEQVLGEVQLNTVELSHENRRQCRVNRSATVHLGGRTQRNREGRVGAGNTQVAFGNGLGHRHRTHRRAGYEAQLERRPHAREVLTDRQTVRPNNNRVDHEEDQQQANVECDNERDQRTHRRPTVREHSLSDQTHGAQRC